ncbi:hypothetical protein AaE_008970, partial [Aphanomyces astaci]
MSTAPIREAPPLLRKDKRVAGGKSPVKTAWAKEGSSKSLIPAVGGKYSVSATPPPTSTTTATASPSPTKPAPSKPLIPAETASPAQMSPPKHQIMSPAKPKKDLTPSPSAPTPPVATPAAADPSKAIPDTLPSSPSLAPDGRRAVNDTPDFETPLGIFGPQLQQRETEDMCFAIGMTTPEVQKLVAIFNDIDLNCSGLINLVRLVYCTTAVSNATPSSRWLGRTTTPPNRELYFLLDTPQNKYTSSILRFSTHQSDPVKLDIDDFVRIVCTFALMSQTDIYRFCFETFDEDDSGSLSKDEFVVMCDSIQIKGDGFFQGNFKKAMEAFDANHDGLLDFAEFIEMNRKFPLVFWPLFHFQETMQEKTLGKRMWTKIRARQLQIDAWRHYM